MHKMFYLTILILFIVYIFLPVNTENFDNNKNINYYVVAMKKPDRLENIALQTYNINKNLDKKDKITIQQIDAVVGVDLDMNELVKQKIVSPEYIIENTKLRKGQIGCYMSFLKTYNLINSKPHTGYSIVFEDDFIIKTDNFIRDVDNALKIMKNVDFDILFLGHNSEIYANGTIPKNRGKLLQGNIHHYDIEQTFYGMEGILINNKNIAKILQLVDYIDEPIDQRITRLAADEKLKIFTIHPVLVEQQDMQSNINVEGLNILGLNFPVFTTHSPFTNYSTGVP